MVKLKDLVCITLIGMAYQYMLSSCSCSDNTSLSILPLPESVEVKHGTFCCDESKAISFADSSLEKAAGYLSDVIYKATGNRLPLQQGEDGDIRLLLDGKQNVKGGYSLEVNENNVTISSSDYSGVICGISTLNQLFAAGNGKVGIGIPCVNIVDNPRYEWRGVLLDVSRHFFDKEEVKELLDKKSSIVIAVSEGIKLADGRYVCELGNVGDYVDAFGHKQLQGTATYLANFLAAECNCKTRAVELSTLQRSASHMASRVDIDEAFMVGGAAVKAADEGDTGKMVVIDRISDDPYMSATGIYDVHRIANEEKLVPRSWMNKEANNVTKDFVDYIKPLIQGDYPPIMVNGMPRHLVLKTKRK